MGTRGKTTTEGRGIESFDSRREPDPLPMARTNKLTTGFHKFKWKKKGKKKTAPLGLANLWRRQ